MNYTQRMKILSGMSPEFPTNGGRRPRLYQGRHLHTLARFIEKPKRGRPTFVSYSEKTQTKFDFIK